MLDTLGEGERSATQLSSTLLIRSLVGVILLVWWIRASPRAVCVGVGGKIAETEAETRARAKSSKQRDTGS